MKLQIKTENEPGCIRARGEIRCDHWYTVHEINLSKGKIADLLEYGRQDIKDNIERMLYGDAYSAANHLVSTVLSIMSKHGIRNSDDGIRLEQSKKALQEALTVEML